MYSNSMDIEILDVSSCVILRSFPFCICFTCFKCKDFDSERSPRSYKKCLGRDLLASRAPPQCSPSLSLSFSKPMYVCGADCVFPETTHQRVRRKSELSYHESSQQNEQAANYILSSKGTQLYPIRRVIRV